ncbi:Zinc finger protein MAGPIE [Apostasia shenzhenica]|uniref:Zinc finger protein MAGPIE n=1 Tax=Apostasia shenzhenica TaxID=1088818 RepID=A0A2I0B984_9ASPA|nr:Zinc finger protein MAGPIE [Apostasia shenzhenica]
MSNMFNAGTSPPPALPAPSLSPHDSSSCKRKRRPAGTPDPEAEVVSLSPRTLLESDRYVCEICNQGFQRDQNLQMHRRRHKVPWKLLKRESGAEARKRVFVCPEPSCLHHHPSHALGDLVGIKKHFRRKHSSHKQWSCHRCSKAYAVHSDFKAHLKTCGTRGHSCDCGRVFSRVESFIEHQDMCSASRVRPAAATASTQSRPSINEHNNFIRPPPLPPSPAANSAATAWFASTVQRPPNAAYQLQPPTGCHMRKLTSGIELQLLPAPSMCRNPEPAIPSPEHSLSIDEAQATKLELSVGPSAAAVAVAEENQTAMARAKIECEALEQLRLAVAEKAVADETRLQARRQKELAELDLSNAKRIRQQAQMELNKTLALRDHALKRIHATLLQITCFSCKQHFNLQKPAAAGMLISDDVSFGASHMSSVVTDGEGEDENLDQAALPKGSI